jgi:Flp pilus assembly protein TadG
MTSGICKRDDRPAYSKWRAFVAEGQIRRRSGIKGFARNRSGVAAVEAAFVLPAMLAGLFFVIETGRVFFAKVEFDYAVHAATRLGMVANNASKSVVEQELKKRFILLAPANLTGVTMGEVVNADNTRTATLTASYQFKFFVPFTQHKSITLTRTVSFLKGA